jgi:hypothetical protein
MVRIAPIVARVDGVARGLELARALRGDRSRQRALLAVAAVTGTGPALAEVVGCIVGHGYVCREQLEPGMPATYTRRVPTRYGKPSRHIRTSRPCCRRPPTNAGVELSGDVDDAKGSAARIGDI